MSWRFPVRRLAAPPAGTAAAAPGEPERYAAPRLNPMAVGAASAITGGLIAAIAWLGPGSPPAHPVERRLVVLNLAPPPAAPAEPVPPKVAQAKPNVVTVPAPVIAVPAPSPPAPTPASAVAPPSTSTESQIQAAPAVPISPVAVKLATPIVVPDLSATLISARPPDYPILSRRNREQGTVVLRVTLTIDGKIDTLSVERSSGVERLDKAAVTAVKHWRWSPTLRDGLPVIVSGIVRLPFVLRT